MDWHMRFPASQRGMLVAVVVAVGIPAMPVVLAETAEVARVAPPIQI